MARLALGRWGKSPFSKEIENADPPRQYSAVPINRYDGKTDPAHHVRHFEHMMILYRGNDSFMCKVFPSTLEGSAISWFNKLEPRSIRNWKQLAELFTARFISSSRPNRTLTDLMHVKMEKNETIREYSRRFFDIASEVPDTPIAVLAETFKWGLPTDSALFRKLAKRPTQSLDELINKVGEYARLEHELQDRAKRAGVRHPSGGKDYDNRPRNSEGQKRNDYRFKAEAPIAINTVFTEPLWKILKAVEKEEFFRWPAKQRSDPNKRDQSQHCKYHRDFGHKTEKCRNLRYHLEELARAGHLQEFVKQEDESIVETESEPQANQEKAPRIINVIHGCADDDCYTKEGIQAQLQAIDRVQYVCSVETKTSGRKRNRDGPMKEKSSISFTEKDLVGVSLPHKDPLVVTLDIGERFTVRRILVDGGAEAEIMYLPLFQQLELKEKDLKPMKSQLVGFGGQWTMARGRITLPVRTGGVKVDVNFIVVDAPSPHNAILGRGWLHAMKAIPSTYHQVVKFVTPDGVKEIRGEQRQARICSIMGATGKDLELSLGENNRSTVPTEGTPEAPKEGAQ